MLMGGFVLLRMPLHRPDELGRFADPENLDYWMGPRSKVSSSTDIATSAASSTQSLHLLYARFWRRFFSTWVTCRTPSLPHALQPGLRAGPAPTPRGQYVPPTG